MVQTSIIQVLFSVYSGKAACVRLQSQAVTRAQTLLPMGGVGFRYHSSREEKLASKPPQFRNTADVRALHEDAQLFQHQPRLPATGHGGQSKRLEAPNELPCKYQSEKLRALHDNPSASVRREVPAPGVARLFLHREEYILPVCVSPCYVPT